MIKEIKNSNIQLYTLADLLRNYNIHVIKNNIHITSQIDNYLLKNYSENYKLWISLGYKNHFIMCEEILKRLKNQVNLMHIKILEKSLYESENQHHLNSEDYNNIIRKFDNDYGNLRDDLLIIVG